MHRALHRGIQVLDADAQAIETEFAQERERAHRQLARIDLDTVLAAVVVAQGVMRAQGLHQRAHLVVPDKRRRPAAPMQLVDRPRAVEQFALEGNLTVQARQVGCRPGAIFGYHFIAGAVKAQLRAERQMDIQRQRARAVFIPARGECPILALAEIVAQPRGRGIRGIARPRTVVTPDQIGVEIERALETVTQHRSGPGAGTSLRAAARRPRTRRCPRPRARRSRSW